MSLREVLKKAQSQQLQATPASIESRKYLELVIRIGEGKSRAAHTWSKGINRTALIQSICKTGH